MIRRLRTRFIAVAMVSMVFVLAAILGIVNIVNYNNIMTDADSVLALLRDSGGGLPELNEDFKWQAAGERYKSPELFFEIRFFSAQLNAEKDIVSTQTDRIFAVSDSDIAQYVGKVLRTDAFSGFVDNYRFLRYSTDDGEQIVFLDCGRQLTAHRSVLVSCVWISAAGLIAIFLLVTIISGRIMRPVTESYDKQRCFITDAGHDLKTPLTVIDADAALLEMETGENEWLKDIQLQTAHLAKLTEELIELSRMEEPGQLQRQRFPLSDIVQETCESFKAPVLKDDHRLDLQIPVGIEYTGDEKSIARLITILMDNAAKYVGGSGEIAVRLETVGKSVRLTIENDTDGIEDETIRNMFERFYRGDQTRSSAGHGIGLSIAKAIVESHKGRITAASRDKHRLIISVWLPQ